MLDKNGVPLEDVVGGEYSILDENGALQPEIDDILSIIKERNMVLASGHISPQETFTLFERAKKVGIEKMVVTHGTNFRVVHEPLTMEDMVKLGKMGAYVEHTALQIMPGHAGDDPAETTKLIADTIRAIDADQCVLGSDMGPLLTPAPAEGMKVFITALMGAGITPEEIELMVKVNPSKLLDLD